VSWRYLAHFKAYWISCTPCDSTLRCAHFFLFVNPSELGILSPRRQMLQWIIKIPEFNEFLCFPQLFLMKDNPVGDTFRVKSDSNCLKCCPYVWGVNLSAIIGYKLYTKLTIVPRSLKGKWYFPFRLNIPKRKETVCVEGRFRRQFNKRKKSVMNRSIS
jgi:hypothetical protein